MASITVTAGRAPTKLTAGVYQVVLTDIKGPRTVTAQQGPKAGQDIELLDWIFEVEDDRFPGEQVEASTSLASGPKSKMFSYLTALANGRPPAIGAQFDTGDLVGMRALATVSVSEDGWARIENLGAIPASMLARQVAASTGAPTTAAGAPGPVESPQPPVMNMPGAAVAAGAPNDNLPF